MRRARIAAAAAALALAGSAARAQVAYIPPGADKPRFGGEFALAQPGPVAGYWPTQCRLARLQLQQNREGPSAPEELKAVLTRFVSGVIAKAPAYGDFSPGMAEAVRRNLPIYWPSLNKTGYATVAKRIGADPQGNDVYIVDQTGGRTFWSVAVNGQGKIESATLCQGQGL